MTRHSPSICFPSVFTSVFIPLPNDQQRGSYKPLHFNSLHVEISDSSLSPASLCWLELLFPGGVAPVSGWPEEPALLPADRAALLLLGCAVLGRAGCLVACFSLSLLVGALGRVIGQDGWKSLCLGYLEKSLLGILTEVLSKDTWKSHGGTNSLSGMAVGFISFRNLSLAAFAILRGGKRGFPVVKEVKREAFVGSHKASAKVLLSSCALRLCAAAAAEMTGSWKCCWSWNSLRAAISSAWPWDCQSTQRKTELVLPESPSNTERLVCRASQAVGSRAFGPTNPLVAASSGELALASAGLAIETAGWDGGAGTEWVSELETGNDALHHLCDRKEVSKYWPLLSPNIGLSCKTSHIHLYFRHHSTAFSDFILFVEETGTGWERSSKEQWSVEWVQRFQVWSKAARRQLFWSRSAPQTAWFGGRLTWPDPLLPLMLGTGTWEEASDYFIAGFRATSGAVLSMMPLRRVSLCFD